MGGAGGITVGDSVSSVLSPEQGVGPEQVQLHCSEPSPNVGDTAELATDVGWEVGGDRYLSSMHARKDHTGNLSQLAFPSKALTVVHIPWTSIDLPLGFCASDLPHLAYIQYIYAISHLLCTPL